MDIIQVAQDLIRFRSETGNAKEINQVMDYIKILFAGTDAKIDVFDEVAGAPVIFIRNTDSEVFDALVLGHIDVVAASEEMFTPQIRDGKMYGRGTLDMKSFAAVALNSMEHVLKNKLPIKFGVILSSDEEKGSNVLQLDGSSGGYAQLPTGFFDGRDTMTISMDVKSNLGSNRYMAEDRYRNRRRYNEAVYRRTACIRK